MAVCDKALNVANFELDIMLFGQRPHLHFLDYRRRRTAFGFVRLLFLRVTVLVEVHYPAYWRLGGGRDLDQIQAPAFGQPQSVTRAHDSGLRAVGIAYPPLGRANRLVDANRWFARWRNTKISNDKTPPPAHDSTP